MIKKERREKAKSYHTRVIVNMMILEIKMWPEDINIREMKIFELSQDIITKLTIILMMK